VRETRERVSEFLGTLNLDVGVEPGNAERAPATAAEIPPDEIPATVPRDDMMRLDAARRPVPAAGTVVEPQDLTGVHGGAQRQKHVAVNRLRRPSNSGDPQLVDPVPPSGRRASGC
jgi:hypothetical protein